MRKKFGMRFPAIRPVAVSEYAYDISTRPYLPLKVFTANYGLYSEYFRRITRPRVTDRDITGWRYW